MPTFIWFLIVFGGLALAVLLDRAIRARQHANAIARRRWFEYAEMAARNAEPWRTR